MGSDAVFIEARNACRIGLSSVGGNSNIFIFFVGGN